MSDSETSDTAQRKKQVSDVFGRAAVTYDQVGPRFFAHFGRRLVEIARIPAGSKVLDVATGRGAALVPAIESVGARGHVVGIDIAGTMVQETSKALAALKLPANFELHRMDAEQLQFPDESFDYVLCGFALFFFPQLDIAMSEFRRVLRPKGHLCVSTWDRSGDAEWEWFNKIVEAHLPPEPQPDPVHGSDTTPGPVFDTMEGLQAILEAAGFQNVQITAEAREFVYPTSAEYWATLWSHGKRRTLEEIEKKEGREGLEEFKTEIVRKIDTLKKADGLHQVLAALFGVATKSPS